MDAPAPAPVEPAVSPAPAAAPAAEPAIAPAAAPAPESVPAPEVVPAVAVQPAEAAPAASGTEEKPKPPFELTLELGESVGVQTDADLTNVSTSLSVTADWNVRPWLTIEGMLTPYIETTSMPVDNRRFDFLANFSYVRALFPDFYKDPTSGIALTGSLSYRLPVTYNDWRSGNPRLGDLAPSMTATRKVGDFTGTLGLLFVYHLYLNARAVLQCDPAAEAKVGASCPSNLNGNSANEQSSITPSLRVDYNHSPWSVFGKLALVQAWSTGPGSASEPFNTNDNANERFSFAFAAQVGYSLSDHWTVGLMVGNLGPQTSNGRDFSNFVFDKRYAYVQPFVDWTPNL